MNWQNFVGPATFVYLISMTLGGIWWASDLSVRMGQAEKTISAAATVTERIVRLETLVTHVDVQLNRIESKLDDQRNRR